MGAEEAQQWNLLDRGPVARGHYVPPPHFRRRPEPATERGGASGGPVAASAQSTSARRGGVYDQEAASRPGHRGELIVDEARFSWSRETSVAEYKHQLLYWYLFSFFVFF